MCSAELGKGTFGGQWYVAAGGPFPPPASVFQRRWPAGAVVASLPRRVGAVALELCLEAVAGVGTYFAVVVAVSSLFGRGRIITDKPVWLAVLLFEVLPVASVLLAIALFVANLLLPANGTPNVGAAVCRLRLWSLRRGEPAGWSSTFLLRCCLFYYVPCWFALLFGDAIEGSLALRVRNGALLAVASVALLVLPILPMLVSGIVLFLRRDRRSLFDLVGEVVVLYEPKVVPDRSYAYWGPPPPPTGSEAPEGRGTI
jgi:hypothetical protein